MSAAAKTAVAGVLVMLMLLPVSCTKKQASPVQEPPPCHCLYSADVKPFIIAKCAVAGCHVAGFPFGDFTGYQPLKDRVDNGRVRRLVLEEKLMPPAGREPLTPGEITALDNWIRDGAQDN